MQVLMLACAAQRLNKDYIKHSQPVYSEDNKLLAYKWDNKFLVQVTLDPTIVKPGEEWVPPLLCTNKEDADQADEIKKFYRRLMFAAIDGENEFRTEVNSLLEADEMPFNKTGFIACLPSVYKREYGQLQLEKRIRSADVAHLACIGDNVLDKDCEVLACQRSKNFDAFNVDAIIENKIVSWMSKNELKLGPAVVIKAKVKDHAKHWKHDIPVTRLNYVKAAQ